MTSDQLRDVILAQLCRIAPEVQPNAIDPRDSLRNQIDLDSIDFLNLIIALHEALGVEIPEADYARLATLDEAVEYLSARLSAGAAPTR
jgi:acyl carrier protein